jgi:hypothetical protein
MARLEIRELTSQLLNSRAQWQATENPISRMDDHTRRTLLGVNIPPGYRLPTTARAGAAVFDPAVDWRNRNGNHVSPIKDQGGCGSCVSITNGSTEVGAIGKIWVLPFMEASKQTCQT